MVVCVVTGLMVGDRRSPGATILGVEVVYTLRQPSGVSPADRSRTSRWLALWTVYVMAVPERSDGFTFLGRRQVASILLDRGRCSRWQVLCVLFGSYSRVCSGTSVCGHLLRQRHLRNDVAASLEPAVAAAAILFGLHVSASLMLGVAAAASAQ